VTERAPHLEPWLPLIAIVAGLDLPSTAAVDEIQPSLRKQRLEEIVSELLGMTFPGATTLIFNDVHLMDDASRDLIARLAADTGSRHWLLVTSRRPESPTPLGDLPVERFALGPLGDTVVAAMLAGATAASPLPPQRLADLAQRTAGNPLFLRELVAQLQEGGDPDALPRSVEGAITARIDRLMPADRRTLRSAAVFGMDVEVSLLREVAGEHSQLASEDPDALIRLSEFLEPVSLARYRFSHQLIREVAYEGLPYRRRVELHSRTAAAIERIAGADAEQHAELLSLHCLHGGRYEAAWRYSRIAAERSRARYASAEAADSYRRALAAATHVAALGAAELAVVNEALGELYVELGEFSAADLALRRALRRVPQLPLDVARLQLTLSGLREMAGRFNAALRWTDRAELALAGCDGSGANVIRGRIAARRAQIRFRQGRYGAAMAAAETAMALARAEDDRPTLATALEYADLCAAELGRPAGPGAQQALAIYEELGDLAAQARVQNTLGMLAYHRGEWPTALEHYAASESADIRCGRRWHAATPVANSAEILADQGRLEEARVALEGAVLIWRGVSSGTMIAFGEYQLGRIAARQGDTGEAMRRFDVAREHFRGLGELTEVVVVDALAAECLALAGDHAAALAMADATLARAQGLGGVGSMMPLLQRVRGASLRALGRPEAAQRALRDGLEAARRRGARHEIAFTLAALIDGAIAGDAGERQSWRVELAELSDELGIDPRPRWGGQGARA
jgi:tetratricopeptide (TPR) repeat protein